MQLSVRKLLLLSLNLASTLLTLFSDLRENPIIVFVTGRYDLVRARMTEGAINYDIVRGDLLKIDKLTNLTTVGERYRFISAPKRSPNNLAEDRSTCVRVNSMNATMMTTNYDDFWGKDNFEDLQGNRVIQVSIERDFEEPGVPFLKCLGRPERTFQYMTDLVMHQSFWAGGSFHVELQSSKCLAVPLIRNPDWEWGLFQVEPADHAATVGIFAAIVQSTSVYYVPDKLRFLKEKKYLRYFFPCMAIATTFPEDDNTVIRFKGALFMASDVWMNHWLYITLSILDSLLNLRMMYMVLEMGTWMLTKKVNFENFTFMCCALTKITWVMCAIHLFVRMLRKIAIRGVKSLEVVRTSICERMGWYVNAYSLFLSYKAYSILLCTLLFLSLRIHGGTSFMKHWNRFPNEGIFGGSLSIAQFWGNETATGA